MRLSTTPAIDERIMLSGGASHTDEHDQLYAAADDRAVHPGLSPRRAVLRLDRRALRVRQDDRDLLQAHLHGLVAGARARRYPPQPRRRGPQHRQPAQRYHAELMVLLVQ